MVGEDDTTTTTATTKMTSDIGTTNDHVVDINNAIVVVENNKKKNDEEPSSSATATAVAAGSGFVKDVDGTSNDSNVYDEYQQTRKKNQRRRVGLFIFACLYTFFFVGAFFGWGPMQLLVRYIRGSFISIPSDPLSLRRASS